MSMKTAMDLLLRSVLISCLIRTAFSQDITDMTNLQTQLFTTNSYNYRIRPIINQSLPIDIFVEFTLLTINGLDEVTETLKTTGYIGFYWIDELLKWTPATYGGIETMFWPQNEIWKPDIALKNSYLDYKRLGDSSLYASISYDGVVRWSPFQVFQSTCSFDITYFPFDTQNCQLEFVAWSYLKYEVMMEGGDRGIYMAEYEENSSWDVLGSSWHVHEESEESSIIFVLTMRRKPLYSMLTLVFPIVALGILNLFVFILPSDGGEKAGYAVTVFLAFAVFLTIMESSFPQNSETIAYFAIYVVIMTVQSIVITLISLASIRCASFEEDTKIPTWLLASVRFIKCKALRNRRNAGKIRPNLIKKDLTIHDYETNCVEKQDDIVNAADEIKPNDNIYTWKYVVNTLDIFFFLFFLLAFVSATLICLVMAQCN